MYFQLGKMSKICAKHDLGGISNTKSGKNLTRCSAPIRYTSVGKNLLHLLKDIGLDAKQFGPILTTLPHV